MPWVIAHSLFGEVMTPPSRTMPSPAALSVEAIGPRQRTHEPVHLGPQAVYPHLAGWQILIGTVIPKPFLLVGEVARNL